MTTQCSIRTNLHPMLTCQPKLMTGSRGINDYHMPYSLTPWRHVLCLGMARIAMLKCSQFNLNGPWPFIKKKSRICTHGAIVQNIEMLLETKPIISLTWQLMQLIHSFYTCWTWKKIRNSSNIRPLCMGYCLHIELNQEQMLQKLTLTQRITMAHFLSANAIIVKHRLRISLCCVCGLSLKMHDPFHCAQKT